MKTVPSNSATAKLDVDKNFENRTEGLIRWKLTLQDAPTKETKKSDTPAIPGYFSPDETSMLFLGKTTDITFHEAMRAEIGEANNEQWPHRDQFHQFYDTSPQMAQNYRGPFSPKLDIHQCAEPVLEKWIYIFRRIMEADCTVAETRWYAELFIDKQGNYHAVPLTEINPKNTDQQTRKATLSIPDKKLNVKLKEPDPETGVLRDIENFALLSRDQLEIARIRELWEEVEHLGSDEQHPLLTRIDPPDQMENAEKAETEGRKKEQTCQSFYKTDDPTEPIQLYLFDPWTELEYRCVELNAILSTCARFSAGLYDKALQDDYVYDSDEALPYGKRFTQWINYSNPLTKPNLARAGSTYKNPQQECSPQLYKLILAVEEALEMNQYSIFGMKGSSREWYHHINRKELKEDKTDLENTLTSLALHREYYGERMVQWLKTEPFLTTLRQYAINRDWFDLCLHRFTDLTCLLENTNVGKTFLNEIGKQLFDWLLEYEDQGEPDQDDGYLIDPDTPYKANEHLDNVLNKGIMTRMYLFFPTARRIIFQFDAFNTMDQLYLHISNGFIQHRLIEMNKTNPMTPKQRDAIKKSIQMMLEGVLETLPDRLKPFFDSFWDSVQNIHEVSDWKFLLNNDGTAKVDAKSFTDSKVFKNWFKNNLQDKVEKPEEFNFKFFDKFLLSVELFNFYQYLESLQRSGDDNELKWNALYLFGAALDLANSVKFAHQWYGSIGTEFGKNLAKRKSGWAASRFGRLLQREWFTGTLAFISTMIDITAAMREYAKAKERGQKALADAHMINVFGYIGLIGGIVASGFTLTNPLSALLFWGSTGLVMIGHILVGKHTQSDLEKWLLKTPWGGKAVAHHRYAQKPEWKWDYSTKDPGEYQSMLNAYHRLVYDHEITITPDSRCNYDDTRWENIRITILPAYMEINDLLYLYLSVYDKVVVFPTEQDPYAAIDLDNAPGDHWEVPESWIHFQYGDDRKKKVSTFNGTDGVLLNHNPNVTITYRTDDNGKRVGYESFSFTITRYIDERHLPKEVVKKEYTGNGGPDRKQQKGVHIYNYENTREKCVESPFWADGRLQLSGVVTLKRMVRTMEKEGKSEEEESDPLQRNILRGINEEEKVEKQVTNIDEWRPYNQRIIPTWKSREKRFAWPGKYPILPPNKLTF